VTILFSKIDDARFLALSPIVAAPPREYAETGACFFE